MGTREALSESRRLDCIVLSEDSTDAKMAKRSRKIDCDSLAPVERVLAYSPRKSMVVPKRTAPDRRREGPIPSARVRQARERAISYLVDQRVEHRRSPDGRIVGIQSSLSLKDTGEAAIPLYEFVDGVVSGANNAESGFSVRDSLRETWQCIADEVLARFGFPLEAELFSNMLFVALVGVVDHPRLRSIARALLSTFRHSHACGLYHFFTSLRFACDIDCTGVAAKARLVMGDIDLLSPRGVQELRRITDRILRSAAICDLPGEANRSHGKDNGPLRRNVFKVYVDDHQVQGAEMDRGLKNNPVAVANALIPVLIELSTGNRQLDEVIPLREYPGEGQNVRTGRATVAEIVAMNVAYVTGYFLSGDWQQGCRYYGSPDAFLCFYTELIREFEELAKMFGIPALLVDAIDERRRSNGQGIADPTSSLNLSLRAIAAGNLGVDRSCEIEQLLYQQGRDGGWSDFGALYALGSNKGPRIYFGSTAQTTAFAIRALAPTPSAFKCTLHQDPRWPQIVSDALLRGASSS